MKKLIITSVLSLLALSYIQAQINRPKVNVNTKQVNSTPAVQGLEVRNLDKMTAAEFKKLKIPVTQVTKERLNAKPTRTWSIKPMKLMDGRLRFKRLRGVASPEDWALYFDPFSPLPRLSFTFNMLADVYYKVRVKPKGQSNLENFRLTLCDTNYGRGECFDTTPDHHKEFSYIIMRPRNTTISFSLLVRGSTDYAMFYISDIIVERLN